MRKYVIPLFIGLLLFLGDADAKGLAAGPMATAIMQDDVDSYKRLLGDQTRSRSDLNKLLAEAAFYNAEKIALFLISLGADVNHQDQGGNSQLHILANWRGSLNIAAILVAHGAEINMKNDHGQTALHIAASEGYVEFVKFLLSHGANASAKSNYGWTPLHDAIGSSNGMGMEVVRILVEYGADVNAQKEIGFDLKTKRELFETPLSRARKLRRITIAEFLVQQGAEDSHDWFWSMIEK